MLAIELLNNESCEDRLTLFDFDSVHFLEAGDDGLLPFPEAPPAFSLVPGSLVIGSSELPDQCPELTTSSFDPEILSKKIFNIPVTVALGFTSLEANNSFYAEKICLKSLGCNSAEMNRLKEDLFKALI